MKIAAVLGVERASVGKVSASVEKVSRPVRIKMATRAAAAVTARSMPKGTVVLEGRAVGIRMIRAAVEISRVVTGAAEARVNTGSAVVSSAFFTPRQGPRDPV